VISSTIGGSLYKRLFKTKYDNIEYAVLANSNGTSIILYLLLNTHSFIMPGGAGRMTIKLI
jgi:hypothetical protein